MDRKLGLPIKSTLFEIWTYLISLGDFKPNTKEALLEVEGFGDLEPIKDSLFDLEVLWLCFPCLEAVGVAELSLFRLLLTAVPTPAMPVPLLDEEAASSLVRNL